MITFKRALMVAAFILTCFIILRNTHPSKPTNPKSRHSPLATGSYEDSRKMLDEIPGPAPDVYDEEKEPMKVWNGDNGGREAIKRPKQQIPIENLKTKPLRQQLAYTFPYEPEGKFPAYIWQTWKYTPGTGEFQEAFRAPEASWTQLHPSFVHEVITDTVAVHLIRHFYASIPEVHEAYNALPEPVLKADFFRYLILLARGGIYTDIDTTALKSAVEWVPPEVPRSTYGLVIGIEADPERPDWKEWYSRRIQFCQWTIQSKVGHPVLVDVVATITEETLRRKKEKTLDMKQIESVMEFTGPAVWTDAIFKFFNNAEYFDMSTSKGNITWEHFTGITESRKVGDVVVLPITSFSPGVGQMNAGDVDDPMAFVQHKFEGSWKPENERNIGA